jgi:hypothetical protein
MVARVNDRTLGAAVRARRHQRGWRLVDLAAVARVGATQCGLVERGQIGRLTVRSARQVASAVGIDLAWDIGWQDQNVRRLLDADHSAVAAGFMRWLGTIAWLSQAEVSFNHYGDRGRIDVLAFHATTKTLLVVEIKTVLVDAQALLGGLDVKRRLARRVAAQLGWRADTVVPAILMADGTSQRRHLERLAPLFERYALRGRAARRWLVAPDGPTSGLFLFVKLPNRGGSDVRRAGRRRVRPHRIDSRQIRDEVAGSGVDPSI